MIPVSNIYKENVKKQTREIDGFIELIVNSNGSYFYAEENPLASIQIESDDKADIVNLGSVADNNPTMYKYASFEQNRFILDGSMILANNNNNNKNTGYISENVGNTGSFEIIANAVSTIILRIGKTKDITLYFEEGYATEFQVELIARYSNGTNTENITYGHSISNNTSNIYTIYGNSISDTLEIPNEEIYKFICIVGIRVNVIRWSENNRRIRIRQINAGETNLFKSNDLIEINILEQTSLNNFEAPGNECNISLNNYDRKFNLLNQNNMLNRLNKKTYIRPFIGISIDGVFEYIDLGSYQYSSYRDNSNKTITIYGIGTIENNSNVYQKLMRKGEANPNVSTFLSSLLVVGTNNIRYDGVLQLNKTKISNFREQLQSIAIFSGNYIKESRAITSRLENRMEVGKISYQPLDNLNLSQQLKEPKITKYNKTKNIKFSNTQIGELDNTEKVLVDDYILDTTNDTAIIYTDMTNPIDISSIKVYKKNKNGTETRINENTGYPNLNLTIYNSHYVPYFQIENILNNSSDGEPIKIKIVGKEYKQAQVDTTITNTNLIEGETIEYNNSYIDNDYDKKRIANYLFNNEFNYEFETEILGDPSLEVGDTIIFETIDGYMLGVIEKIDLKYNGGLIETISGVCKNVL